MTTKQSKKALTEKLARRFAEQLEADIGSDALDAAIAENAAEADPSICHSHDHCDASESMMAAMTDLGIPFSMESDGTVELINAAWDLAKANRFYADERVTA